MSRAAYLGDAKRELLKDIIKEQFKQPDYSDEAVVIKVNKHDLLKLDGGEINEMQVAKVRKEAGLKIGKKGAEEKIDGRTAAGRGRRSKKFKKNFDPSGGGTPAARVPNSNGSGDFEDMIAQLEEKRDGINAAIEALKAIA